MHESAATTTGDHVAQNRAAWDRMAADYVESGRRNWASDEVTWGIFDVPESRIGMLPPDLAGMDAVELGCGTAYVSAWLARRGARPVGIDNSPAQLETARRFQAEFGLTFPLHLGDAEQTPFADESFDFAISEYGAAIWCDPYRWIPEAARILRPGGRLSFLGNSVLLMLTTPIDDEDAPASEQLQRPLFGMYRFAWEDGAVEFHLPARRDDPPPARQRLRGRGPGRSGDRGGRDHPLPVRLAGVGAPLAGGRGLEGAEALSQESGVRSHELALRSALGAARAVRPGTRS